MSQKGNFVEVFAQLESLHRESEKSRRCYE